MPSGATTCSNPASTSRRTSKYPSTTITAPLLADGVLGGVEVVEGRTLLEDGALRRVEILGLPGAVQSSTEPHRPGPADREWGRATGPGSGVGPGRRHAALAAPPSSSTRSSRPSAAMAGMKLWIEVRTLTRTAPATPARNRAPADTSAPLRHRATPATVWRTSRAPPRRLEQRLPGIGALTLAGFGDDDPQLPRTSRTAEG